MSAMPGILVGVDGSHHSERALEWAMKEAALRHVSLTVLTVHQVPAGWLGRGTAGSSEDASLLERTKTAAQEQVDKVLAGLGGPHPEPVTVQAVDGVPAEALLGAAADADVVVVGARGSGGFAKLRMGSVSDQVAHHAHCPVVIVPHDR
jgi:nucleotide-binding universal stress UspA family protein